MEAAEPAKASDRWPRKTRPLANLQKLIHQASDDLDNPDKSMDAKGTVDSLHADLDTWLKGKAE